MAQKGGKPPGFKPGGFPYSSNLSQNQLKDSIPPHFFQFKKEYDEFKHFVRNSLLSLRKELENVLFSCFLQLFRMGLDKKEDFPERFKVLRSTIDANKGVFMSPRLLKELMSISNSFTYDNYNAGLHEVLEKVSLTQKNVVYLSEFAYECLFSFFEIEKKAAIMNSLSTFLTIKLLKDPVSEANYKNELLRLSGVEDLEKMSAGIVNTLPAKADFDIFLALDQMTKKKLNIGDKNRKYKVSVADMSFLSDSLKGMANNTTSEGNSAVPVPEIKLASRVSFAINYLERIPLGEEVEPSILQATLSDPLENQTCVEIGLNCNVVLFGSLDSSIMMYLLNPDFLEEHKTSKENIAVRDPQQPSALYYKFLGHESAVTSISLHYDELYFISSSVDTTIRLWCVRSRACLVQYNAHLNTIWKVKFCHKGYYFASGSSDTTAKLWALDRVAPIRIFLGHNSDVNLVDFLPNLQFMVTSGLDSRMIFWEIASGAKVRVLFHYQETVTSLSISPSGLYMLTGSEEGSLIFWDLVKFLRLNCWDLEQNIPNKPRHDIRQKILYTGFAVDESYVMAGSRKKIAIYLVKTLKEKRNEDIYKDLKEEEEEKEKTEVEKSLERSFFDNQGNDFFLSARFHERNHIFLVSKSLI